MPKPIDDITPPNRSVRNIPIPERRKINLINNDSMRAAPPAPERIAPMEPRNIDPEPHQYSPGKKSGKGLYLGIGVLAVLALGYLGLSLFSGSTLTYTPKSIHLTFNGDNFTASKIDGDLLYSVVKLSSDKSVTAKSSGATQVSNKAKGTIIVFNDYSSDPQKLVKNTRFQSTNGNIYRIQEDITIPGKTTNPGQLEVTVYADQPGDAGNIGLSDFVIPGLKGDPRYTSVYARSKTPMTGGFVGTINQASDQDVATAKQGLETALKSDLDRKITAQVPDGFVFLPGLSEVNFTLVPSQSTGTDAVITERGDFSGVIFKKNDLAQYLASKKVAGLPTNATLDIPDLSSLKATLSGAPDLENVQTINFSLNGSVDAIWKTDENSLKSDLAGKDKSDLATVLKNYPSIDDATASFKPFWKHSFPSDPGQITIVENATK